MRLIDYANLIRSKNAGPFVLTIDIMFADEGRFEAIRKSGVLNRDWFARTYHCELDQVRYFECPNALAFKISVPRPRTQGTVGDADLHGGQQFAPLLDLAVA